MKAALLVLAVTAAPALAETVTVDSLALEPVEPQSTPAFDTEPCEGTGLVTGTSKVVGLAEAIVVHECGAGDLRGLLAIHTAGVWFIAPNSWIAMERVSSNIIRRIAYVRDHLGTGVLADGTKSVVYTLETLSGTKGALRIGHAIVCTTGRDTTGRDIACTKPVGFVCGDDSCTAPRLSRGVLIVHDDDAGVQRYALSVPTESEQQR